MKNVASVIILLIIIPLFSSGQSTVEKIEESEFSIGKTIKVRSDILQELRVLNIYLPANYSVDSTKNYPVIYLLDGSKDEDFLHISGIVQFGSFPWINILPESIVVGIENVDRKRDFTYPSQNALDQKEFPTAGRSAKFIAFLGQELQPFIETNFRTTDVNTIIGQSLGGLLATEILMKSPDLFDHYLIVSPSLWWDDGSLLNDQSELYNSAKSVYIAVGKEGDVMEQSARKLHKKLLTSEQKQTKLYFSFLEDKTHGDVLHQAVYEAFELIFKSDK